MATVRTLIDAAEMSVPRRRGRVIGAAVGDGVGSEYLVFSILATWLDIMFYMRNAKVALYHYVDY